jgi:hypothetical protein
MQLLALAQELLPPDACTLGSTGSSSSSSSSARHCKDAGGSGHPQQQQQQQQRERQQQEEEGAEAAWQLCLAQVQHNLLLALQVMKHWQYHNAHMCLGSTIQQLR